MPPESARSELVQCAAHYGIELDDTRIDALLAHLQLLDRWSRVYNLTALRDPLQMLRQHLVDSLALVGPLQRHIGVGLPARVLDVGSGAGFPGLSVAIALPRVEVICVDSVGKKVGFIRQVIAELSLKNARAEHARVEELDPLRCDVVTSRAFASLNDFVGQSRHHLGIGGCWVAMKGQLPDQEIEQLPADVDVFHVEQLDVPGLDAARCLVWMRPRAE